MGPRERWVPLLARLDDGLIFEEEDGAVAAHEAVELFLLDLGPLLNARHPAVSYFVGQTPAVGDRRGEQAGR